jgi:hypothetical protein
LLFVTNLLSKKYSDNPFFITSKNPIASNTLPNTSQAIVPSGMLLLQTISQTLYCFFLVFSTRSAPVLMKPFLSQNIWDRNINKRKKIPLYSILKHTDSYLPQILCWFPLKFNDSQVKTREFEKSVSSYQFEK